MPRPFRFLAGVDEITDGRSLAETARRAEAAGVDVLVVSDHLVEKLGPVPTMAHVAAVTDRVRVGTFVFNNDLRHPAVLAQDLATLDVLSGGRLEIGIGAGWNEPEYRAIGLPFEGVGTRVSRLEEAVILLKGCFGPGPFSFAGEHYQITDHDAHPKPVQRPHPPFLIGGGGRRTLTLAAREAQIVGLAPRIGPGGRGDPYSISVAATAEKIGWVREAAGDRFAELELNIYPSMQPVTLTDHPRREVQPLQRRLAERTGVELPIDELLASPHVFVGTLDSLAEKLLGLREELGISSVMIGDLDPLLPLVERLRDT